jgi:DNA-binding NtrC family response regulator
MMLIQPHDSAFPSAEPGTGVGRPVLVVDDDAALSRTVHRLLTARGYEVVTVNSGQAAIDALLRRHFDVVVSDIQMPGMSGVELLSEVRAHDLDVPVILMTGDPRIETAMEAVSVGALQYLVKPVDSDVLV